MRTRLDLMPQCVDAFSRALTNSGLHGHFSPLGDGRIEFRLIDSSEEDFRRFVHDISSYLFRLHAVEVDMYEPPIKCEPLEFTLTDDSGQTDRLPLRITYLCSERGRLAPVLSIVLGGY